MTKKARKFNPYMRFNGLFIPNCIAQSYKISDSAKILLGRLFQFSGQDGKCYPGRKRLCSELSWSLRKLDHKIKELKDLGLIKTEQKDDHSPSTYTFYNVKEFYDPEEEDNEFEEP